MASYTSNLNLKKPLGSELYDIEDQNSNMDIIDNAINRITSYVTDEIATGGTWINGEPIYRKLIQATNVYGLNTGSITIPNVDTVVNISGTAWRTNTDGSTRYFPLTRLYENSEYHTVEIEGGTIKFIAQNAISLPSNFNVIVEYTKK